MTKRNPMWLSTRAAITALWLFSGSFTCLSSSAGAQRPDVSHGHQREVTPGGSITQQTTIKFHTGNKRAPTSLEIVNGVPLVEIRFAGHDAWALLDNRMEQSLVDTKIAQLAGIVVGRSLSPLRTATGELPRRLAAAVPYELPGQFSAIAPFAAADLTTVSLAVGRPVSMVIGHEYFAEMTAIISAAHGTLQLGPSGSAVIHGGFRVQLEGKRPQLRIMAGDQPLLVTLDLGYNGGLALSDSAWQRLKLNKAATSIGQSTNIQGKLFSVAHAEVKAIRIGGKLIGNIAATRQPILPLDGDGLLGMGILSQFDVVLDTKAGLLWLTPPAR